MRRVLRAASRGQKAVYRYVYTHVMNDASSRAYGAGHGMEVAFVFGDFQSATPSAAELGLSGAFMDAWSGFARTGTAAFGGKTSWPPYDVATDPFLTLDVAPSAGERFRSPQCDFWDSVDDG